MLTSNARKQFFAFDEDVFAKTLFLEHFHIAAVYETASSAVLGPLILTSLSAGERNMTADQGDGR
jgi:hypothetical protein